MLEREILKILKSAKVDADAKQLESPPSAEMGDASFPCFHLAKQLRKDPKKIAEEIARKIKIPRGSPVSRAEAIGGYVNFFFNYPKFSGLVISDLQKKINSGKGAKAMVEYSQPNPVHPMHVGHARSTFLGDSLANILDFVGYDAIRANYMNNVGLQVAKLVLAYRLWSGGRVPNTKPDLWLWKYYVKFHEEAEADKKLEDEAHAVLKSYELDGDKNVAKLWDKIVGWCVKGFQETYKNVGVKFDEYFYESKFRKPGKKIVNETLKKGISKKTEDNAVFADLEKHGVPGTIIQRSDGTGLYITSDLGLTEYKFSKYGIKKSFWVVSSQQDLHFRQLFKIFELLGREFYKDCKHFSYEQVKLAEGKMSSREGRAVMLDDVAAKIVGLAYNEVTKRNPKMPVAKRKRIARQIGIGALKYAIVRIEPQKQIVFDWAQMLSLDGNTGPYLQYAHTRCNSILKKAKKFPKITSYPEMNDQEKFLVKKLSEFKRTVSQAAEETKPHLICNYGYDLATAFNSFYQHSPVIRAKDKDQKSFRLSLVKSTKETLRKVFDLIGMEAPEKM